MESFPTMNDASNAEGQRSRRASAASAGPEAEASGLRTPAPSPAPSPAPPRTPTPTGPSQPVERTRSRTGPLSRVPSAGSPFIRPSAVRIRRLPSTPSVPQLRVNDSIAEGGESPRRRRSLSEPQHPGAAPPASGPVEVGGAGLATVTEEQSHPNPPPTGEEPDRLAPTQPRPGRLRAASDAARSFVSGRGRSSSAASPRNRGDQDSGNYDQEIVDLLDVVDPEVGTLNTLNNVQNTLFIPYLGSYFNRTPTYELSRPTTRQAERLARLQPELSTIPTATEGGPISRQETMAEQEKRDEVAAQELTHTMTIKSVMDESHFAVLPHGTILPGWSDEDKAELNDYVRHCLHSRRAKFKRSMKAFGKYIRKPTGFLVTLYAFLLFFWGLAWVLFLIGWIYVKHRQSYFVEVCDQVLTALFACVGIGLAPFRIVDTYHMIYIVHYHFITWRLRRQKGLPELVDPNELPDSRPADDVELGREKSVETTVLTDEQQRKLEHHEKLFSRSHTFYKPHETYTHNAFSIQFLLAIVILFDCHSCLQMALGGTTWGIYYKVRPKALTAIILTFSISCNITAGILISIGDKRSRKKEVVEQLFRQALTQEGIHHLEQERGLESASRIGSKKTPEQIEQAKDGKQPAEQEHHGKNPVKRVGRWARKKIAA